MPKLGVVLFGASTYDNHHDLNNPRFANSAKQFMKTISNPEIVPDCSVTSLDLYDEPALPSETLIKITDFVSQDFDNVIIYYCGHGDVALKAREYRVFLRKSKKTLRNTTMLDVNGLINDVQGISAQKTVYFVLDACFSGAAIEEFMDAGGTEALIDRSLCETITQRGVAVFAATNGNDVALARRGDKLSLFTGAFVRCLNEGIPYKPDVNKLSWFEVRDEIARSTRDRLGPDAPVPKIMSVDEKFGDVTRVPFFLNRAYVPSKKSGVTTEELYWRNLPDDPPLSVLHDFLTKFPDGIFAPLARALADKQIGRVTEAELEEHLAYYPKTKFKRQIAVRLTSLKRARILNSADIAALEKIAAENPEIANEARYRINFIRQELAEAESWERVKTSSIRPDLEQFLEVYPEGRFSELAMARLAELSATSNDEKSWRPVLLGRVPANALNFKENWRRYAVVVALLALGAAGALLMAGGNSSVNIQAFRKEFVAVGNDPVKLRAFILHCAAVSCPMEQEARDRLGKAEEAARRAQIVEAALDAAGIDLAQLRKFVQQCDATSCAVAQEAHDRLAKAEEVTHRTQIVEAALDAAGIDLAQLRKFVQQCDATSCAVAQEARTRLAKAEDAERARLARIAETERRTLDAAGTDLGQLRKFVQQCNSTCTVAQEARNRLAKAEDVERTRLAQIAETERRALDATGTDLGQLRKFVQQCNATSCTVAQEARNRLAKAEDAERARLAQIADTDGKALDAAGTDLGQLRKFIQQCNATSCTIAQEAHNRLAKAEDAEHLRLERIAELTKPKPVLGFKMTVGYDMNGGDINSPDYLIRETDAAKCLTKCQATNGCIAYSFDKWIKTCYLKDKLVSLTLDPRSDTSIRKDQSFPGLSNSPKHFCRYPSLAAIGEGPPGLSLPTAKACEQSCETDQTCAAYTFRTTDKLCRLLRNTVDRQKGIGFESNTSGVRTQILCN